MVDMLSGGHWHRDGLLRQFVAQHSIQPRRELQEADVEEIKRGSDPKSEVIECVEAVDSSLEQNEDGDEYFVESPLEIELHDQVTAPQLVKPNSDSTTSRLPLVIPHCPMTPVESANANRQDAPMNVPTMASNSYNPALGGLQRLSSTPLKLSKGQRLKRWFSRGPREKKKQHSRSTRKISLRVEGKDVCSIEHSVG